MGLETATSTSTTQIDPTIQPFLKYGLEESQRLYQAGGPQYFTGQGYVGPSDYTQTGIEALAQRAKAGSPLLTSAQNAVYGATQYNQNPAQALYGNLYQQNVASPVSGFYQNMMSGGNVNPAYGMTNATASGAYLGGNQFFQGAFQPAAQAATTAFNKAIGDITSQASKAGRYGSGAATNLQNAAATSLANSLTGTAGQLAYQNYAAERSAQEAAQSRLGSLAQQQIANQMAGAQGLSLANQQQIANQMALAGNIGQTYASDVNRQLAAAGMAPEMAQADYADINKLLAAGQFGEGYQQQALQAAKEKFAFEQAAPQANLTNYLNQVYGFPAGRTQTTQTPYFTNPTATNLGTGLLALQLLDKGSPYLQRGYNWLMGGGDQFTPGSSSFVGPMPLVG